MLYICDCMEGLREQGNETVDLVVTDPPYGVSYKTNHRKDKTHKFTTEIANDGDLSLSVAIMPELYRVLKPDTALYYFCSSDMVEKVKPIVAEFFKIKNVIIWVKNNWTAGDLKAGYGKQYEMIIYANKGRRFINGRRDTDVWYHNRVVGRKQLHQNQKPLDLIERILLKSSNTGDVVLDPFMGSGTTAVACIRSQREFIGYELDPFYYNLATNRIEEAYGINEETSARRDCAA
jgi:site-specific DNA-methyltransferase (adenine-specific)